MAKQARVFVDVRGAIVEKLICARGGVTGFSGGALKEATEGQRGQG